MNAKKFCDLEIGSKFHEGKSYGTGHDKNVLSWEVLKKVSKSSAVVVSTHGSYGNNTMGHTRAMSAMSRVFLNI